MKIQKTEEEKLEARKASKLKYVLNNKEKVKASKDKYYQENKEKIKERTKKWCDDNRDSVNQYNKEYYISNKEQVNKSVKIYSKNNIEKIKIYQKNFYTKNKEFINDRNKEYRENNKDKINIVKRKWVINKRKTDNLYKLKEDIRSLIRTSFNTKSYIKNSKTLDILGCSFDEFKEYIESRFELWMTWNNKGNPKDGIYELNKTWDIDHIIPLSTANTEDDIIRLNHYTNLQPLCSYTNRFIKKDNLLTS